MLCDLYHADCHNVDLSKYNIQCVASDPPFGCKTNCDYTRFSGGLHDNRNYSQGIYDDDKPFDPTPWLKYPQVVLFGYQYFASRLPIGTILVWLKKRDNQLGTFLSDAELAWVKGGKGVYVHRHVWHGFDRQSERGQKSLHPTQKPIEIWKWILTTRLKLEPGQIILDPYMGSGSCGVACMQLGLGYIGIEINKDYFKIAQERIGQAQKQSVT